MVTFLPMGARVMLDYPGHPLHGHTGTVVFHQPYCRIDRKPGWAIVQWDPTPLPVPAWAPTDEHLQVIGSAGGFVPTIPQAPVLRVAG